MKFYPADSIVEVQVNFTDLNGNDVTPTAVTAVLYDEEDSEIVDFGSLPLEPEEKSKVIVVPAVFNGLDYELRAARILRVNLKTAAGTISRSLSYILEAEQRLQIMTNTFQSYESAMIASLDMVNLTGWSATSEEQRRAALVEAYRRITMIPMKYGIRDDYDKLSFREEHFIARDLWEEITPEMFAEFPTHFRKALRRAQLIEANELLQGDAVARKRRSGIVSETIGESSMTIKADRVDYGLNPQTMAALTGYVHFNMRVARA